MESEQSTSLNGLRILVVEDQAPIALQMDMLVESECQVVGPASRVEQALKLLDEQIVDAAVLDLNIAGEMVYPVAEVMDARGLPYVFATGCDPSDIAAPYKQKPVLRKPFSRRTLLEAIQRIVGQGRAGF